MGKKIAHGHIARLHSIIAMKNIFTKIFPFLLLLHLISSFRIVPGILPADANNNTAFVRELSSSSNVGRRTAGEMVAAGFKRYGVEKGILIFRFDGSVTGTEYLYFDHWGWREGKYTHTEANTGAYNKKVNKIQFLDGERRYQYDPATATAHFFESRQVQKAADKYGTKDMTIVGDEMIRRMGGVVKGTSQIRGVTCQVWSIETYKTELSMWKGITLGERSKVNNQPLTRTCILLDTISEIPLDKLTLPKEVKIAGAEN